MEERKPNFHKESINSSKANEPAFNVFLDEYLVAEVRGNDPTQLTVIPMRELNDYEEDKLHEYIQAMLSNEEY
jgi:hypothetical protein